MKVNTDRSMRRIWRVRVATFVGIWLAVVVVMSLLDMDPRPILLAAIGAAAGAVLCLMLDVSDVAAPVAWHVGGPPASLKRGSDLRIALLQRQLVHASSHRESGVVHESLVQLIDDRLLVEHGIDRAAEPRRAAAVLGVALEAFVITPPSSAQLADARYMSIILDRVETL